MFRSKRRLRRTLGPSLVALTVVLALIPPAASAAVPAAMPPETSSTQAQASAQTRVAATSATSAIQASPSLAQVAAETEVLNLMNRHRADAGLRAVRLDIRLVSIARERSTQMATYNYFSHTLPDGRSAFAMLTDRNITYYSAGEIIAWNTSGTLLASATQSVSQWMNSDGHRAIILSDELNYLGIGVAVQSSTGRVYWTGFFIKGPDRTGAWTRLNPTIRRAQVRSSTGVLAVPFTFSWRGSDVLLQTLTAGFRDFQVQRRVNGGSWVTVWSATTRTWYALNVRRGLRFTIRIRARDRAGNYGGWVSTTVTP